MTSLYIGYLDGDINTLRHRECMKVSLIQFMSATRITAAFGRYKIARNTVMFLAPSRRVVNLAGDDDAAGEEAIDMICRRGDCHVMFQPAKHNELIIVLGLAEIRMIWPREGKFGYLPRMTPLAKKHSA